MTGRTGYNAVTNSKVPDFGGDLTAVYAFFDPLIGETRSTASALPASGNWVGRTILVADEKRQYIWTGSGWDKILRVTGGATSSAGDVDGFITVTHGLGQTPVSVTATIADDTPTIGQLLKVNVRALNSTTFQLRFYRLDSDTPYALNAVKCYWTAIG